MASPGDIALAFPNLASDGYRITSPETRGYNCIAWAAHDTERFWWPDKGEIGYWPVGVPRRETIEAFVAAYATMGFSVCETGNLEDGFEKIAIYATNKGPSHAARQLANGRWTSKLGSWEDIEHNSPAGLTSKAYGTVVCFLKRERPIGT